MAPHPDFFSITRKSFPIGIYTKPFELEKLRRQEYCLECQLLIRFSAHPRDVKDDL